MDIISYFQHRPEIGALMAVLYLFGRMLKAYPGIRNNWIPLILAGISIIMTLLFQVKSGALPPFTLQSVANAILDGFITSALTVGLFAKYKATFRAVAKTNKDIPLGGKSQQEPPRQL